MSVISSSAPNVVSIDKPVLTPQQEQEKWLGEAVHAVSEKSSLMKLYIRQRSFIQVLRSASQMLAELRTGMLAPQNYYELYVKAFDEMQYLEQFFEEEHQRGRSLEEIYEVVQHAGNIVPRLYLLITAGSVYIKSGEQPAIEILRDLVEMCKGVQHPTRGLFLRHFLLTMMKNKLPGDSSRTITCNVESDGGTVDDTADLILQNFKEMNWLWIRMEAKGPSRIVEQSQMQRKHKDRKELRVLVGMNIVRLSHLEGVERQAYKSTILPRLLNIIIKYREPLAQQYLLEVIVQVFPDEFHLFTIDELLNTLENVSSGVDVCTILRALMERLGNYAASLRDGITEACSRKEEKALHKVFDIFLERMEAMASSSTTASSTGPINNNVSSRHVDVNNNKLTGQEGNHKNSNGSAHTPSHTNTMSQSSYVEAMLSLARFALRVDPSATDRINIILAHVAEQFEKSAPRELSVKTMERMLTFVIETLKDPAVILSLDSLSSLVSRLPFRARREVALALCTTSIQSPSHRIASLELAGRLFELMASLVLDEADRPANRDQVYPINPAEEFEEEQHLVCRVLHLLQCTDLSIQMKMLSGVRKQLGQGGPERIVITLPALASLYVRLALRIKQQQQQKDESNGEAEGSSPSTGSSSCAKAFHTVYSGDGKGILEILASEVPMQTFPLFLTSANAADACELTDVSYELYVAALQIYEENAADTRQQIEMLHSFIASLHALRHMPEESYELLATKICQYSSKLVRKSDQSRMVAICAHLFWKNALSDESHIRVLECLQRSLKIADHTPPAQQLPLFVDLLNIMLHYYAGKAPGVTVKYASTLIDLVQESSEGERDEGADAYEVARLFYRNTARYIRSRRQVDDRWQEIDV